MRNSKPLNNNIISRCIALTIGIVLLSTVLRANLSGLLTPADAQSGPGSATTNPSLRDTDGDGYYDGPDGWYDMGLGGMMLRKGEDTNGNGKYEPKGADGILGTEDDEYDPNNPNSHPTTDQILDRDSDRDGLSDAIERALGSSIADADTDNDGVSDGDEVYIYHTSALQPDTDYDGLPDGFELGLTATDGGAFGKNNYNSAWHESINTNAIYMYQQLTPSYFSLKDRTQYNLSGGVYDSLTEGYCYTFKFRASSNPNYRSDPHSFDSDHDGYADGLEILAGTDPMRGLVRAKDLDTEENTRSKLRLDWPYYTRGWAPVNRGYGVYLNLVPDQEGIYQWQMDLPICLGMPAAGSSTPDPITVSVFVTYKAGMTPNPLPKYLIFNGVEADSFQIDSTKTAPDRTKAYKVATLRLVSTVPDAIEIFTLNIDKGDEDGDGINEIASYPIGRSEFYIQYETHQYYLDQQATGQ